MQEILSSQCSLALAGRFTDLYLHYMPLPLIDSIKNALTFTHGTEAFHFFETEEGFFQADSRGNRRSFDTLSDMIAHCEMYQNMGWATSAYAAA